MKMYARILDSILAQQRRIPPETGGILGGTDGIVTSFYSDEGEKSSKICSYCPNTNAINNIIANWQEKGIAFMGLYHTHFGGSRTLSKGDKTYIAQIMHNMPDAIDLLYFPLLVFPDAIMVVYYAKMVAGKLLIEQDTLDLID